MLNEDLNSIWKKKYICCTLSLVILVASQSFSQTESKVENDTLSPPVQLTAAQDHQRLMNLLHIDSLRPGPSGNPSAPNAANSDESKANPYPELPDPLVLNNGQKVITPEMWWKLRRPEIKEYFDKEIYGRMPENTPKVNWEVISTTKDTIRNIPAVTRKIIGHVDNSFYPLISVDINLTLTVPANLPDGNAGAKDSVPVIMEFGFKFPATFKMTDQMKKFIDSMSAWQRMVLSKGWGYAILIPTSFQEDNGAGLTTGIIGLVNKGQPRKLDDWGTLRAWAWGASRALDYLKSDKYVDGNKVGIEGLSRYGKAALVTMAYDQRFAIGFIGSSGEGGASLLRRNFGEMIESVASTGEYHWMAGNFLKYAGPLTAKDLPVDAHELIAMCAPRPVFISCGSPKVEGNWVDDKGQFMAAAAAGPVYKLLEKKELGTSVMPQMGTALIDGDIAFRQHHGGHTTFNNWPTFIKFAERYLNGTGSKKN
jgi:(4-O-methyl)-D-glucuronate---lignin esterase